MKRREKRGKFEENTIKLPDNLSFPVVVVLYLDKVSLLKNNHLKRVEVQLPK